MAEETKVVLEVEMDASRAEAAARKQSDLEEQITRKRVKLLTDAEAAIARNQETRAQGIVDRMTKVEQAFQRQESMANRHEGRSRSVLDRVNRVEQAMRRSEGWQGGSGWGQGGGYGGSHIGQGGFGPQGPFPNVGMGGAGQTRAGGVGSVLRVGGTVVAGAKMIGEGAQMANSYQEAMMLTNNDSSAGIRAAMQSNRVTRFGLDMLDAYTGREFQVRRQEREAKEADIYRQEMDAGRRRMIEAQTRISDARATAEGAGLPYQGPMMSSFNRQTPGGERAYEEEQRRAPMRETVTNTERQVIASVHRERDAAARVLELAAQERLLREKQAQNDAAIQKNAGRGFLDKQFNGDPAVLLTEQGKSYTESLKRLNEDIKNAREQLNQARQNTAEARGAAEKAKAILQADLPNIQARLQIAERSERNFGGMTQFDRAQTLQAIRTVKQMGVEFSPPELVAIAEASAGNTIGRLKEESARRDPIFKILKEENPGDFVAEGADDLRKKQAESQDMLREAVKRINEDQAKVIAELAKDLAKVVQDFTDKAIQLALREFKEKLQANAVAK